MKNIIFILFLLAISYANAFENDTIPRFAFQRSDLPDLLMGDCDACGCSASGGSMGFSSMLNNNFAGVRYFYQSYSSRDGIFNNSPWIDENFNTVQVWAKIPVSRRLQVSALVPYHFHNRQRTGGKESIEGLGDITALVFYTALQTKKDSVVYSHKLQIGGGLKAPTGKYDSANNLGSVNPSFQVGTGSWDWLLAAEYVINRKKLGLNMMLNYTVKTENSKGYRFGNQFNYGGTFFHLFDLGKIKLMPQAGIAGEVYGTNRQHGQNLPDTAGNILFSKIGFEAGKDKLSIGINAMLPVTQNLTGGNVEANYRLGINLNYTL